MFCVKCGAAIGANDKFCVKCGAVVQQQPISQVPQKSINSNLIFGILIGVTVLIGLILALFINHMNQRGNDRLIDYETPLTERTPATDKDDSDGYNFEKGEDGYYHVK